MSTRRWRGSTAGCSTTARRCRCSGRTSRRCWRRRALDWSEVDPSILGTLFERGLDPGKRAQLGAHYTDGEKILQAAARRVGAGEGGDRSRAGTCGSRPVARRADETAQRRRASVPGVPDPATPQHPQRVHRLMGLTPRQGRAVGEGGAERRPPERALVVGLRAGPLDAAFRRGAARPRSRTGASPPPGEASRHGRRAARSSSRRRSARGLPRSSPAAGLSYHSPAVAGGARRHAGDKTTIYRRDARRSRGPRCVDVAPFGVVAVGRAGFQRTVSPTIST